MVKGILAVVSHPDDETFGCGGTLALHAAKGQSIDILCLTCNPPERLNEFLKASKTLGIHEPVILEKGEVVFSTSLIRRISDSIVDKRPKAVITHIPFDYHRDHRLSYKAVKEAIEWAAHTTTYSKPWLVSKLFLMEINTLIPSPHYLIDVTESHDKKKEALDCYKSQLSKFPWGYYERFNLKKAELRGAQADCRFAEAFLEESIARNSPFYKVKKSKSLL